MANSLLSDIECETQRRLTDQLFRNAPFTWAAHLVNAALLAGVNATQDTPPWVAAGWWALIAAAGTARYALARHHAISPNAETPLAWQRRYVRATAFLSASWGAGALLFVFTGGEGARLFTGLVVAGMVAGVVPLLVSVPAALQAFVGLAGLPMAAAVLIKAHTPVQWAFGFMSLVFMGYILSGAKHLHRMLEVSIRLGLEQGRLAESLEQAHAAAARTLTERKDLEEAMRRERDFAEGLIDTAQAIVIVLDLEGRILRFNRFMEELSGYAQSELQNADWFAIFPLEAEQSEARARFQEAVAGGRSTANTSGILARDGRRILVEWHDKPLRDADGTIIGLLALGQDVTERERLAESQRLLSAAVEQSIASIVITDTHADIQFVNAGFTRSTGYTLAESIGQNPRILKSGHTPPKTFEDMWAALNRGLPWEGELVNRKKNGEEYWELARISPVVDVGGRTTHYLAVKEDITQRKAMEEELQRLATTDPLTGVANRRRFLQEMDMELARHKRFQKPAAFLLLDLDHFKRVNDTYGHATGDLALRHLAELARMRLRRLDLFGRLGGEEFGILLPGTGEAGAVAFAEHFRHQVAHTPVPSGAGPITLTVSLGLTTFDPGDADPDAILARADAALYRAKEGGRNRVASNPAAQRPVLP
ncbi:sensor domain-containing diguanylate cyclase [Geothrix fuzhouensis]|uniref:sensor domain-containing diguanylate cyclase n=1 Tax=Geothrix fuzhouensis TaxID=2966451 RepID=UPI0021498D54|nr:diguanylate cyclase [Geothrix fuzhouensis]